MNCTRSRSRRPIRPPEGYEGYLSRREAATRLGLASEFKIRQFEREGHLHAVRGRMGTAFYPEAEVLNLRATLARAAGPNSHGRWSDADLIALLQQRKADGRRRGAVDLVTEAQVSIARAERVYRFWLNQGATAVPTAPTPPTTPDGPAVAVERRKPAIAGPRERRSPARLSREALLRQMRHPDPRVRAAAFAKLKDSAAP